jgi:hypothetical protein
MYYIYSTQSLGGKKNVTSGGVRCSKWTPIYILKKTKHSSINKEDQRKGGKKQRCWHWTNIWPWVPARPDARCERAGWLPAVSFCFCFCFCSSVSAVEYNAVNWIVWRVIELVRGLLQFSRSWAVTVRSWQLRHGYISGIQSKGNVRRCKPLPGNDWWRHSRLRRPSSRCSYL